MSKILLGMSGGIDSCVAAWLLKRDACDVVGVTLRFHESPLRDAAISRAQECAQKLGIEHHVIDMREEFARIVKEPTAKLFAEGLSPNPCSICSRELKMDALFQQAEVFGCETVATGHYARVTHDDEGFQLLPYQLRKPIDKSKDQTYLLYALTQEQLSRLVFPLADIHKGVVRRMAMQAGLMRVAPVNDGQGDPCFFDGEGVAHWLEEEEGFEPDHGDIVYISDNAVIDSYEGQYRYGPDQELGRYKVHAAAQGDGRQDESPVALEDEELFAIYKDVHQHRIYAGTRAVAGTELCLLRDVCWTSIEAPAEKRSCRVRTSYARKPLPAQVVCKDEGVVVAFSERIGGIGAGQTLVMYSDDLVLGGGVVAG